MALCDFLARSFQAAVAASSAARDNGIRFDYDVGQYCLETNHARVFPATGTVRVMVELSWDERRQRRRAGRVGGTSDAVSSREGEGLVESLRGVVKRALLSSDRAGGGLDAAAARAHVEVGMS